MPFIPLIAAIALEASVFTIAAAALGAVGFVTDNESLQKVGALAGLASGFLGGGAGLAGGAEGIASSAPGTAEAVEAAFGGAAATEAPALAGAKTVLAGADPTAQALRATPEIEGLPAQQDLVQVAPPSSPAEAALQAPSSISLAGGTSAQDLGVGLTHGGFMQPEQSGGLINDAARYFKNFFSGDATKGALVKAGGEFLAKGFGRNPQEEQVEINRQRLAMEQAELQRRIANLQGAGQVRVGMTPNLAANLFPQRPYRSPALGLINRQV